MVSTRNLKSRAQEVITLLEKEYPVFETARANFLK